MARAGMTRADAAAAYGDGAEEARKTIGKGKILVQDTKKDGFCPNTLK
jgi:hypothetical protein